MADRTAPADLSPDLKDIREHFESDSEDWDDTRRERAKDMRYLAGDPWDPTDRKTREDAGRPCISVDELTQYTNQIVNDMRVNPLSVNFEPGPPVHASGQVILASEETANVYADKWREIEYRSYAHEAYAIAYGNCVDGSYGFSRLVSEFAPGSFDQELRIKAVSDPNTIVPGRFQSPDLSDMQRCFVLEPRPIKEFKRDFPKAKTTDFSAYVNDKDYSRWVQDDKILLAEHWCIEKKPVVLLLVQPPPVTPPPGMFGMRPAMPPPPITIPESSWAHMPPGSTVINRREDWEPSVRQQLINGVEVLSETTWPGPYIPIAGCLGHILYLDEEGTSKRVILSSIRLAREPYMAYCWWQACKLEMAGMITKNPYWAYEGQISPEQQQEIAKSLHEPVSVLFAKATTEATGQQLLPLPPRNPLTVDISTFEVGAENMRRGIQSSMGSMPLPTQAQRQNEKTGVALESIRQTSSRGTFHFFDHYKAMRRHLAVCGEAAMDTIYDTKRQITVRRRTDSNERMWINDPANKDAVDMRGSCIVDVSDGPSVDSTREAASEFADALLASKPLLELLGPQKSQQIAALAIKLKVKQTGIGAIGEQIVDIIDPPQSKDGQLSPEQMQTQLQQAKQLLQQAQQEIQKRDQVLATKQVEQQGKMQIAQVQDAGDTLRNRENNETKLAVAELGAKVERLTLFLEERARLGTQAHEGRLALFDAAHEKDLAAVDALASMAKAPPAGSAGSNGSGA